MEHTTLDRYEWKRAETVWNAGTERSIQCRAIEESIRLRTTCDWDCRTAVCTVGRRSHLCAGQIQIYRNIWEHKYPDVLPETRSQNSMANNKVHLLQIVAARRQPMLIEFRLIVQFVQTPQILRQLGLAFQCLLNQFVVFGSRNCYWQLSGLRRLILVVAAAQRRVEALHNRYVGWGFVLELGLGHIAHEAQQSDPDGLDGRGEKVRFQVYFYFTN